ncbi:sugar ABC transporter permease [Neobacillus notoginsengisoli]|uniref:Sugar ABC transporter permease n=1 Tax=Neobacillus notoginsengisoli TaxID=1578198 RepID=A0A417YEW5_9BACI|nr:sugar ABC transporter permease [Neobacillus notoginsengisoli]RHW31169.1 sugar ABC transporter permease [Neobacillus notoginsengisoli]
MRRSTSITHKLTPWILLLPSLIFLVLFTFYPIVKTVYLSFYNSEMGVSTPFFVGFDNFSRMMEDEIFWKVLKNNIIFAIGTVPVGVGLGLLMAILINRSIFWNGIVKTFFFYPVVIPIIAAANIWLFIYTPEYGMLSKVLSVFGIENVNVLGHSNTVLLGMMVMLIWKEAGFFMIFYLAGLQNVPRELYEASMIDGASGWYRFRKITFPLIMPTTLFVMIIAITNAFKLVDHLVVMTQGGPDNASNLLLYYIYENAFKFMDYGMAATLTLVMLVLLVIISSIQFFSVDKKIHYN